MVETTAVGKSKEFLSVLLRPFVKIADCGEGTVMLPLHIKAVKDIGEVIHTLSCADFHIDGSAGFDILKIRFNEFRNQG